MIWAPLQTFAQNAVGHILNSLPEGLLIAVFAWIMLRLLPRQNSGTRFAVWFTTLLSVAVLPLMRSSAGSSFAGGGLERAAISLPSRWGLFLFGVWILAVGISLLRLANGLWHLRRVRKNCVAIEVADLDPLVRRTIADFNASRSVKVFTSEHVRVPSAIGFFRPMILIPAWALRDLVPADLNIILLHEFAHLRRRDDWTNLLQKAVRAVLFFHPAVWWIENRLSLEREMACDDLVLAETGNPRGYAECLIGLLEKGFARRGLAMAQAAVDQAHQASLRLAQILDVGRPNTKRVFKPALACIAAFSMVCVATVARAPQFVAFQQGPKTAPSESVSVAPPSLTRIPTSMVVPAAFYTRSELLDRSRRLNAEPDAHRSATSRRSIPSRSAPKLVPVLTASTKHSATSPPAIKNQIDPTPSETLVMIRTTQQTGPDSWAWSVSVWRVVWTDPAQVRAQKVPVAHKT